MDDQGSLSKPITFFNLEETINSQLIADLRVANSTPVKSLSTAILRYLTEGKKVVLNCIGVQALNQAVKSVAIANAEAAPSGYILILIPSFSTRQFADRTSGEETTLTGIRLMVGRMPLMV